MIHRLHQIAFLAGLAMATLIAACSIAAGKGTEDWIFWLIWPVMAVHQAEENVCTQWVLGKRYRFLHWVRQVGFDITLSRHSLLNFGVGWTMAILAGLVGNTIVAFPLFVVATETANGLWHLGVSISRRDWSPGTLSSLVATFPLALTLCCLAMARGWITWLPLVLTVLMAFAAHYVFLASLPRIAQPAKATLER